MSTELKIPVIGEYLRGVGKLVEVKEQEPPPPPKPLPKEYIFEEQTAHYEVRLNGETLKTSSTQWDFYGEGTAVLSVTRDAQSYAASNNIGPNSDVEVVAIKTTAKVRKRPENKPCNYDKNYHAFAHLSQSHCGMDKPVKEVVWSSKTQMEVQS